jgi:rhamnulokinase
MDAIRVAAIDLGASSGRALSVRWTGELLTAQEVHRFDTPVGVDAASGHLAWDLERIEREVRAGIAAAAAASPLTSVGVDTWGVDHVLLDERGERVGAAVSYRDRRTERSMPEVLARMPADEIYRRTGIQFQPFNTLYQLAATARDHPDWLARARRLLLLPDWLHHRLCGAAACEYTNATTTQLLGLETRDWDPALLALAGVSPDLAAPVIPAGTPLGTLREAAGTVRVVAPGTHDTASAVAAAPLDGPDEAYISSGTWSLMGVESPVPLATPTARRLNFSNEGGVGGRYHVLRNLAGLWLVQRLRQELAVPDHAALTRAAAGARPWTFLVDVEDRRFLNPESMAGALRDACAEAGGPLPQTPGELARCAFDSLALAYRRVKEDLETLRGEPIRRIRIIGGGSQNRLLDQLTADASQVPVSAGPVETSALGNACVQLLALGHLASLAEARAAVRRSFPLEEFTPGDPPPAEAWGRFQALAEKHRGNA